MRRARRAPQKRNPRQVFALTSPTAAPTSFITPPYKASATLLTGRYGAVSSDGSHVITGAAGAFAGAGNLWLNQTANEDGDSYEMTRTATGWQTSALTPPATSFTRGGLLAADLDSGTTLWSLSTNDLVFNEDIYLRTAAGVFSRVGPGVGPEVAAEPAGPAGELGTGFQGASRELSRALFYDEADFPAEHHGHSDLWPGDTTLPGGQSLYEYAYAGSGLAEPLLVGVANEGPLRSNSEARLLSQCGVELGSDRTGGSAYNAISEDGGAVFLTARHQVIGGGQACATPVVNELYVRVNAEKSLDLSEPILPSGSCTAGHPCFGAEPKEGFFEGASRDGTKAFFLTEQPLTNVNDDSTMDLYEAEIAGSGSAAHIAALKMVSAGEADVGTPGAEHAEVQGVVRVSADGSHVYFVAKGVLSGPNAEGHAPAPSSAGASADNLYVYDTLTGRTTFVATLLDTAEETTIEEADVAEQTAIEEEGLRAFELKAAAIEAKERDGEITSQRAGELLKEAEEEFNRYISSEGVGSRGPQGTLAQDQSVWSTFDFRSAQATPDGEHLLFLSSARLTADDSSTDVPQLFEYDAADERLTRVSIGQDDVFADDGNIAKFAASPHIPKPEYAERDAPTASEQGLAISADGSRVFFTSADALTPQATPGDTSVYEYTNGNVYLISGGADASTIVGAPTVEIFGADSSGEDVLFQTAQPLVPQDGETQAALFDARVDGGFPAPTLVPGCIGETCHGSAPAAPQPQLPTSETQGGGGNLAPPTAPTTPPAKPSSKPAHHTLTRLQRLVKALKQCRHKRDTKERRSCESTARRRFSPSSAHKSIVTSRKGKR